MIRRSFRIGLLVGLVAGIAAAVSKARQRRHESASGPTAWPPIETGEPQAPGPVPARPVMSPDDVDTAAAPGPEPQPAREPADVAAQAPPPAADELPSSRTETSEGTEAEAVAADTSRQPDVATPEWTAADLDLDRPDAEPPESPEPPAAEEARDRRSPAAARRAAKKGPAGKAAAPSKRAGKKGATKKGAAKKAAAKKGAAKKAKKATGGAAGGRWVEPDAEGTCPSSHPVKAKLASKIFHLPGMLNYDRTNPDRCYADADAAEADGLRPSKR